MRGALSGGVQLPPPTSRRKLPHPHNTGEALGDMEASKQHWASMVSSCLPVSEDATER